MIYIKIKAFQIDKNVTFLIKRSEQALKNKQFLNVFLL